MVNNDHCEVQGTSRKGLFPTLSRCSRCNLEDGCNNQDIRDKDQYHSQTKNTQIDEQSDTFFDGNVSTEELY